MAGIIRLNVEGLTTASGQLKQQGDELENLIQQLQRVIDSLPDSWEGAAAEAYANQFQTLKPGLLETRQLVTDIATQIDQTLKAAQDLDSSIASQLR
ncbi:MAG: WXG100 family type VII secretion target [Anaerorhabdus sp.]|uniref:WXG100 family type VII secretion target n=1 Tax=Anaerorhabdus sp. TaxID=1872524 RepID=UPI003A8B8A52